MTPAELLTMIHRGGARVALLPSGRLRITGAEVNRWLPVLAQYEDALIAALQAPASTDTAAGTRERGVLTGAINSVSCQA